LHRRSQDAESHARHIDDTNVSTIDNESNTHPNPQDLLNAPKTQHSKIQVTLKAKIFDPRYLSWRYTYALFDIPLAKYEALEEYPPPDEVKRALEAHLVNHNEPQEAYCEKVDAIAANSFH
jgi:hypothetical protein